MEKWVQKPLHPNDHVNKSQSTNDVFPTAMHIAISLKTREKLLTIFKIIRERLSRKVKEFKSNVKLEELICKCNPFELGQEFSGYHSQLKKCIKE